MDIYVRGAENTVELVKVNESDRFVAFGCLDGLTRRTKGRRESEWRIHAWYHSNETVRRTRSLLMRGS
jgi:hypothetical protein